MSKALDLFHVIDDGVAILRSRGKYRQVKVYHRGQDVYVGLGGAYIRLTRGAETSDPNISCIGLDARGIERVADVPKYLANA